MSSEALCFTSTDLVAVDAFALALTTLTRGSSSHNKRVVVVSGGGREGDGVGVFALLVSGEAAQVALHAQQGLESLAKRAVCSTYRMVAVARRYLIFIRGW